MARRTRTTIDLDDALLAGAVKLAARTGRTLTEVITDALRKELARSRTAAERPELPTFRGRGLRPGVDLDDGAALLDS